MECWTKCNFPHKGAENQNQRPTITQSLQWADLLNYCKWYDNYFDISQVMSTLEFLFENIIKVVKHMINANVTDASRVIELCEEDESEMSVFSTMKEARSTKISKEAKGSETSLSMKGWYVGFSTTYEEQSAERLDNCMTNSQQSIDAICSGVKVTRNIVSIKEQRKIWTAKMEIYK